MRTCKVCTAKEDKVAWVTRKGKAEGLLCLKCSAIKAKEFRFTDEGRTKTKEARARNRSTVEGRNKHNEATRSYRATIEGRIKARIATKLWCAISRATPEGRTKHNNASLKYAKNNPSKANAHGAKRRALRIKRTPSWLTAEHYSQINKFYIEARRLLEETGICYDVDHVIPLQGKTVSGLHVPWNLQVIPSSKNRSKGNRYDLRL